MPLSGFHHPDFSFPVVRRRAGEKFFDLLTDFAALLATRGKSLAWNHAFPSKAAYYGALWRLRQTGLIVYRRESGKVPAILLTAAAKNQIRVGCGEKFPWKKRWCGIWYVLVYDVPERERHYRTTLHQFLRRLRMGCLQKSVWVSPEDMRPQYADLAKAAAVESYSFLFESKTTLGRSTEEIVWQAWNMKPLIKMQRQYDAFCSRILQEIRSGHFSNENLMEFACREQAIYLGLMKEDPLLPVDLWPKGYFGAQVWKLHREIIVEIAKRF